MFMQLLEYLVTNNPDRKRELEDTIKTYGGTSYGMISTLSQVVDTESLDFINTFFNNWNTMSGSDVIKILRYVDKFYRLGFIKFVDKKTVEFALKKVQYTKSNVDVLEGMMKDVRKEEKEKYMKVLNKYNNDELKLISENEEVKNYLTTATSVVKREKEKKEERGQESKPIKPIYEKVKEIKKLVSEFKSAENCSSCPLFDRTFVGFDYNIANPDNENIDVLFIGEAPGTEEAKIGKPFVGKSGSFLRKHFIDSFKEYNYVITNSCMCHPKKNATPTDAALVSCNKLLRKVLQITQPKVVVALGDTALKSLIGIDDYKLFKEKHGGIIKNNGKYIKSEKRGYPILITYHPSFVIRNGSNPNAYEFPKKTLKNLLTGKENTNKPMILKNNLVFYNLPEEIIKNGGSILDVQTGKNEIFILYREKGTTKIIPFPKVNYGYVSDTKNWVIEASKVKPTTHLSSANCETDFSYSNKVMVDWKLLREQKGLGFESPDFDWCILDIEVYTQDNEFPKPEEAKFPVVLASVYSSLTNTIHVFMINDETYFNELNILDNKFSVEYKKFTDEKELLLSLMDFLLKHDVISAWNIFFDIGYIYNRLKTLNVSTEKISDSFSSIDGEEHYINLEKNIIKIPGKIVVDLLTAYKMFSPGEKESFALSYISTLELGITKTASGSNFSKLWEKDREKAVEYNCYDAALCYLLNKKLDIINFINELRFVANSSWSEYQYKGTLIDGLILYYAKKNGKVLYNKYKVKERSYMGGYVYQPIYGRHEIVQFDFSSQYPSIILTVNVGYETFFGIFTTPNDYKKYYYYLLGEENGQEIITFSFFNQKTREFEDRNLTAEELHQIFTQNKITIAANGSCYINIEPSLIKLTIDEIISKRKHFKKLYSETGESKYNVKQYTYKILANSIYGVIGDSKSRLYMPDIAESITVTGQIANKTVATAVEKFYERLLNGEELSDEEFRKVYVDLLNNSYEYTRDIPNRKNVLYGDTDSIFIKLSKKNKEKIPTFESAINSLLKKFASTVLGSSDNRLKVELKYYGIIYLTNVKKRYCVYIPDTDELEVKGMEMVKADYPIFFKEKMKELFLLILKENADYTLILDFIKDVEKKGKEHYANFDKVVGKPVTLQRDEYKSLSPAARGMMLYNSIFGDYFQYKSKGVLFQMTPKSTTLNGSIKSVYLEKLRKLSTNGEKVDQTREEKNMKWICIPFEEDEVIRENIEKLKNYCTPDFSMIDRYWKDRLVEYGVLA